ncbi:hypothetical protein AN220_03955 [Streptomyces nanshensis]|nr:hypothetical protein AN220_03955 [Streptomyces nanshensis]
MNAEASAAGSATCRQERRLRPAAEIRTSGSPSAPSSAATASASGPSATVSTPKSTAGCSARTERANAAMAGWAGEVAGSRCT